MKLRDKSGKGTLYRCKPDVSWGLPAPGNLGNGVCKLLCTFWVKSQEGSRCCLFLASSASRFRLCWIMVPTLHCGPLYGIQPGPLISTAGPKGMYWTTLLFKTKLPWPFPSTHKLQLPPYNPPLSLLPPPLLNPHLPNKNSSHFPRHSSSGSWPLCYKTLPAACDFPSRKLLKAFYFPW